MSAQENLAGGLIGLTGALFGAWLAFSGTQDQLRKMNEDSRLAAKLRVEADISELANDIDILSLAAGYMRKIEEPFPAQESLEDDDFSYEIQLVEMHKRALIYLSQSAASAPFGFGRSITTVVWRLEKLIENVLYPAGPQPMLRTVGRVDEDIKGCIHGLRSLVAQIEAKLPSLRERLALLNAQMQSLI